MTKRSPASVALATIAFKKAKSFSTKSHEENMKGKLKLYCCSFAPPRAASWSNIFPNVYFSRNATSQRVCRLDDGRLDERLTTPQSFGSITKTVLPVALSTSSTEPITWIGT
jgi:hypothetical protein